MREIEKISETYHQWRNENGEYKDIPGFCKSTSLDEIKSHEYVLTPGRYVGTRQIEDDGIPFHKKMSQLTGQLKDEFAKSRKLEKQIRENLSAIGFEIEEA